MERFLLQTKECYLNIYNKLFYDLDFKSSIQILRIKIQNFYMFELFPPFYLFKFIEDIIKNYFLDNSVFNHLYYFLYSTLLLIIFNYVCYTLLFQESEIY